MSTTIREVDGRWWWTVGGVHVEYSGHCETREEAEVAAAEAEEYDGPGSTWSDESDTYIASLEAEVAPLTTRAEAAEKRADDAEGRASAAANSLLLLAHAIERTRVATLQSAIEAIEARAVQRSAQVDVAQEAGGAWEVVAGKSSELLAVADLLRARLRPGPEVATD